MLRPLAFVALAALSFPQAVLPDVPSPAASTVDPCLVACPAGDSLFVVVARKANGLPYPYGETTLHLCGCPGLVLAPVAPGGAYTISGCSVSAATSTDGASEFPLAAGGRCEGALVVDCDGLVLDTLTAVATFDQAGDLVVGAADLAIVTQKIGSEDGTADFDCDGRVTSADREIAAAHLGHSHASVVGVVGVPVLEFGVRPTPDPSRGAVEFIVRAPAGGRAVLTVHDLTGRRLARVLDREIPAGVLHVPWSGVDRSGRRVGAGVYFHRLVMNGRRSQGLLVVRR